jgi:hypothetical protein
MYQESAKKILKNTQLHTTLIRQAFGDDING